ncbi:hypothetical protein [Thiorhodovibrio frisius]|uniref:Uncharacterized protein n=1 Tax=Thiorhodovibrio frisius TaxID=631362 RepID=H8Z6T6_9GAMM|nr:hypothetical protein [Thiorhodovibrio frisius]EIC20802.1 hypothetical protein Thi970DRAFT_04464 [Thiorhodovibrio frisius]WPL21853.1 hypothetical protein Thiofri_01989 [Thiorhodovibrio frisius]
MDLPFTDRPGRRERQLQRRHNNPLFAWPPWIAEPEDLLAAQRADHAELETFRTSFRDLVQRAIDLPADAGSEQVLSLKEELERHYEQACGLPEDQSQQKAAIKKLLEVIMRVLHRHSDHDPVARQELSDEAQARAIHFRLLESPLVADLLDPDSPISAHELLPALLSSPASEVAAAVELFDVEQLRLLIDQSETLLSQLHGHGLKGTKAQQRLGLIRERLEQYEPQSLWPDDSLT